MILILDDLVEEEVEEEEVQAEMVEKQFFLQLHHGCAVLLLYGLTVDVPSILYNSLRR